VTTDPSSPPAGGPDPEPPDSAPAPQDPRPAAGCADPQAAAAAEARWRAVVDAQRDDLAVLRARWPDRTSPESRAVLARLRRRVAPGGDADEAMAAVHAAYDGAVPPVVRRRLEHYAREQLPEGPQTAG